MTLTIDQVHLAVELPKIPRTLPVAALPTPCLRERADTVRALADALEIEVRGTVDVPWGTAVGGPSGQVEVFAASGAVRGRNTDRILAYDDESRPWADLTKEETGDGIVYRLGDRASRDLLRRAGGLVESLGLGADHAGADVVLEQWARLDEEGRQLEAGAGRATVRLSYEAAGLPLLGAGAKTNLHFDPERGGEGGALVRFFHVHRGAPEETGEVATMDLEAVLGPLLVDEWSGVRVEPDQARLVISSAELGLLALPADVAQRVAAPVLAVTGRLEGAVARDGRELPLDFGRYLPLADAKALAASGYASAGHLEPGRVVRAPRRGEASG